MPQSTTLTMQSEVLSRTAPHASFTVNPPSDSAARVLTTNVPEQAVAESAFSRPLQTAAVNIKCLVQSLFSHGASSSKS